MKVYKEMITEVLHHGTRKENRTGVDTLSTFNFNYELSWCPGMYSGASPAKLPPRTYLLDASEGLSVPLLTTKEVSWKNIVVEMLWFLSGDPDIAILRRHGCKFWDPWADESGQVPSAYGNFWRRFPVWEPSAYGITGCKGHNDQLAWVVDQLRNNPMSRRLVISAWAPSNAQTSKLPPCHFAMAFNVQNVCVAKGERPEDAVYEPRLCLHLTQRSCDLALGVPYNMASYGLLLLIMSHLTGIKPGIFAHTLLDLHIYCDKPNGSMAEYNHIPGLQKQAERKCRPLPYLTIDPAIKELADIEALMKPEVTTDQILQAFKLEGYDPHPAIKFKVAV